MDVKTATTALHLVQAIVVASFALQTPPPNLVQNGDASERTSLWQRPDPGHATVEIVDGRPCFTIRNGGAGFEQKLSLPPDSAGKYLLIIGTGSSERVLPDGNITGLPYLWARAHPDPAPSNRTVFQGMAFRPEAPGRWVTVHGIFSIPEGVDSVQLRLGQGSRRDTPHNGSAARVRDVEVRVFETRAEAFAHVAVYNAQHARARRMRSVPPAFRAVITHNVVTARGTIRPICVSSRSGAWRA